MFSTIRPNNFLSLKNFIGSDLKPSSLVRIISFQRIQNRMHSKSGLCRETLPQKLLRTQHLLKIVFHGSREVNYFPFSVYQCQWEKKHDSTQICLGLPLSLHFSRVDQLLQAFSHLSHSCSLYPFSTCSTHLNSSDSTQTPDTLKSPQHVCSKLLAYFRFLDF